jgi:hypothetical protein
MIRPTFTEATDAAEALNLTRHGLLQAAREGKLVAWLQPETSPQRPFIVRAGKRQPTTESTGRKLAMPDGQFLVFERDAMVNLRGNGCLDLSVLTEQNHALLLSACRGRDGVTVELMPGVVLGDGAGNFYEVASEGPRTMALVGFMTKDLEALRAAHDAEPHAAPAIAPPPAPASAHESIADRDARWLALLDQEEHSNPKGAQAKTCQLVFKQEGVLPDTVKAALQRAKMKRAERYRQGGAVTLSKQKGKDKNPAHTPFGTGKVKR